MLDGRRDRHARIDERAPLALEHTVVCEDHADLDDAAALRIAAGGLEVD